MKILHLISSGGMYGAEAVILTLCRNMKAAGHDCSVAAFTSDQQTNLALQAAASDAGVQLYPIICTGQADRNAVAAIAALAQDFHADVVHMHGYKADIYGWLALRKTGMSLVSTCHTWYDNDFFVKVYGAIDRWVLRRFAGVVAVSDDVRQRLLRAGVRSKTIRLIQNGVDVKPFLAIQPRPRSGTLHVGLVGRLAPEKGVDLFVQAAAHVLPKLPATEFTVVGDGPDRVQLEAMIHDLELAASVHLAGRSDDMPAFYQSVDMVVSASREEGLPIALLEAMASGLPVIATAVGEVPKLIVPGVTGLLVPAGQVSPLAEAIEVMLRDGEQRSRFGLAGRQRVLDEYSAERMSQSYLDLYCDVAGQNAHRNGRLR